MNKLLKAIANRQARGATTMAHAGPGGWLYEVFRKYFQGSSIDWELEAGRVYGNSTVGSVINFKARAARSATVRFEQLDPKSGKWVPSTGSTLPAAVIALLRKPNAFYSWDALIHGLILSWDVKGNGYVRKIRSGSGKILELYWVHWDKIKASAERDPSGQTLLTHYYYSGPDGRRVEWEIADVIHVRHGLDPEQPHLGLAPLASAMREIVTENHALNWTGVTVKNQGRPSFIVMPKVMEGSVLAAISDKIGRLKEYIQQFTGDRRGDGAEFPIPVDIVVPNWKPTDVELSALRKMSIDSICANLGVSAKVVDLPTEEQTFNNKEEAVDFAGKQTIIPMLDSILDQISHQILGDFGIDPDKFRLAWNYDEVWWLIDDAAKKDERHRANWQAGGLDLWRYKELIGEKPVPSDKGVTYFDLQARSRPVSLPNDTTKKEVSPRALAMVRKSLGFAPTKAKPSTIVANTYQTEHDRLIVASNKRLKTLVDKLGKGDLDKLEFARAYSDELRKLHKALYDVGVLAGGGTIDDAASTLHAQQVVDLEQTFIQGLISDVKNGVYDDEDGVFDPTHGALNQRVGWYAQKSSASATQGFVDASGVGEEWDWDLNGAVEDHCQDCPYLAENSPYTTETLYVTPRDCSTPCGGNCKCRLVRRSDGQAGFNPAPLP
ncbi:MAG: phage portal protein [Armatimonadetes bacterium]|nr:phage portal protein [Armatimonadota bacterium]